MRVTFIKKIYWDLSSRKVHILAVVLFLRSEYRFLSTSSLIRPALLVKAIKLSFFSSFNAETRVKGLRFTTAKLSPMSIAQTESKFGRELPMITKSQLCY